MTDVHDPLAPTGQELRGGVRRPSAVALVVLSVVGTLASAMLLRTGVHHAADASRELACDMNPLIGCSSSLGAWQSHLFGVPNAFLGMIGFAGLVGVSVVLAAGRVIPRWLWMTLGLGCLAGCAWIAWFLYLSVEVFRTLCPYCLVVWTVTIPLTCLIWTAIVRAWRSGSPQGARRLVLQARWLLVVLAYALIAAVVVVGLADKVALLL